MTIETTSKKKNILRNNEYYGMQGTFDNLYANSINNAKFKRLYNLIIAEENIKLAYRNLKTNKGSKTPSTDGKTIETLSNMTSQKLVDTVRTRLNNYKPQPIRRVEIPKSNGKVRELGIPTIMDRLMQQCIKQILEPICEAKFHERNNGFRPNRSVENALAQAYKMMQQMHLYYVVDIDIKGFFDNVNHGKLLKQLWHIGIQDKKVLCIISKMLKGEIAHIGFPEKGTPQGALLSPLLANVVLNEFDWWITSQWEEFPTRHKYINSISKNGKESNFAKYRPLRQTSHLKECYIIRYADDFKIFCRNYNDARKIFIATRQWLKERLGLEISPEKSKIVNLKKNYSEFLGFRLKVRDKGQKKVVTSHVSKKALSKIRKEAKELVKQIQKPHKDTEIATINRYNAYVFSIHNYYRIATNIQKDIDTIAFNIRRILEIRLRTRMTKKTHDKLPKYIEQRYGESKQLRYIGGYPIIPLGYVQHKSPMYKPSKVNNYTREGRKLIHDNLTCVDTDTLNDLVRNPPPESSSELNDNRISLYVGQYGKCAITGYPLNINDMIVIHKQNKKGISNDKYQNLLIVNHIGYSLIYETDKKTCEKTMRVLELSAKKKQLVRLLRGNNNL